MTLYFLKKYKTRHQPALSESLDETLGESRAESLAKSQWLGMAVLTLFGLVIVSVTVYMMTSSHLATRRHETLQGMTHLVSHLLSEKMTNSNPTTLLSRLDDHFSGHADLSLKIFDKTEKIIYQTQHQVPQSRATTLNFTTPIDLQTLGGLKGELAIDSYPDDQLLKQLAWALTLSSLLGATVFAFGGWLLIRRGIKPVEHLVAQIQTLTTSNLHTPLDGSRQPTELQPLVQQFNALLKRIDDAYQQLEGFNADVAHELNTPLATLITSTEVALLKKGDSQNLPDLLGSHLEELQRMSGMIKDMLFLAQVDRGANARRTFTPQLSLVVHEVLEYHEAALAEADLSAQISGECAGYFDIALIKRAISNLLANAARYATKGSCLVITIAPIENDAVNISVSNQGETIAPEHLPRIFDRLYRVDASRVQAKSHHGLGLSIVAAVARMHKGRVFAESENGNTKIGLTLTVRG